MSKRYVYATYERSMAAQYIMDRTGCATTEADIRAVMADPALVFDRIDARRRPSIEMRRLLAAMDILTKLKPCKTKTQTKQKPCSKTASRPAGG